MIIETHKTRIQDTNDLADKATQEQMEDKESAQTCLRILLREQMMVLHPFMPFLTEALWSKVKFTDDEEILMVTRW